MSEAILPQGWDLSNFSEVSDYVQRGKGPKYTEINEFPVVNQKAIRWHGIEEQHLKYVQEEQWPKWDKIRFIREGDILWNSTGTGTIGRACYLDDIQAKKAKVVDSHVTIVRTSNLIDSKFVFYWIKHPTIQNRIGGLYNGSTNQVELSKTVVLATEIPVPPLIEQTRIANKLDELLAQVDTIKARVDAIPAILKRFRQSVLAAAVSGKLTEEWRQENSDSFALAELIQTKTDLIEQKIVKKDLVVEVCELDFDVPEIWDRLKLKSIASKITDGEHKTPKREESGHYLLSARNVRDGYIDLSKVDYVGDEEFQKLRKRCDPNKGDVLISCSGSVGRVSLVDNSYCYVMVRSAALVKTLENYVINRYLMFVLRSPQLQKIIEAASKSTAQANLFLGPIKELEIPLPSTVEQEQIVKRVEQLFAYADQIEQRVKDSQTRIDNLTQSILAKAFRGELVPQDPSDEPASVLLDRIKKEREEAAKLAKAAKKAGKKQVKA